MKEKNMTVLSVIIATYILVIMGIAWDCERSAILLRQTEKKTTLGGL